MKTAEEWCEEVSIKCFVKDKMFASLVLDDIKQIQLDGFKAGERFAAEMVWEGNNLPDPDGLCGVVTRKSMKEAILTDANNRTTLP